MGKKNEKVYMSVTADKYELPVHIAENRNELARIYGMTPNNIGSYISRGNIKMKDNVKFIIVTF